MGLIKAISSWKERKKNSDLKKIKVTSNGAFYMNSVDLFNNKEEALILLEKLNNSIKKRNEYSKESLLSSE